MKTKQARQERQIKRAAAANGFSAAAAAAMVKWRAGGPASNAWLESYMAVNKVQQQ
jgi:hypothetical protein